MTKLLSLFCAIFLATVSATHHPASARPVDLALVLAVDVSGSVTADRWDLQRNGYAAAFRDQAVIDAVSHGKEKAIAVTLVEWSGVAHQRQVVGWTLIEDEASAKRFASAIAESPRAFSDWTSISDAIDFCAGLFADSGFETERRVIDVSGDGWNNNGRQITEARDEAVAQGIVINGLPILAVEPTLDTYYRDNVIGGPNSFVIVAKDFDAFAQAILDKLITEIAVVPKPAEMIATLAEMGW